MHSLVDCNGSDRGVVGDTPEADAGAGEFSSAETTALVVVALPKATGSHVAADIFDVVDAIVEGVAIVGSFVRDGIVSMSTIALAWKLKLTVLTAKAPQKLIHGRFGRSVLA